VAAPRGSVREVAALFLRLGLTAFGGPAAHIALFREEFVRRRGWIDDRTFLDLLAAANLIPGPTSTELAMHIGHRRAGWPGLVVAGFAFLLPAALMVGGLAWAYVAFGALPAVGALMAGIGPVVVAIVGHATVALGRTAVGGVFTAFVAAAALVASVGGVPPIIVLVVAGVVGLVRHLASRGGAAGAGVPLVGVVLPALAAATPLSLGGLALSFAKIGTILFGTGYLLVALLEDEFVAPGLISRQELLDAIAVGQVTPGPVITTATFVGYLLLGVPGAVVATVAITLPAFLFAAASVPVLERLRESRLARAALDAIAAAVVGALVAVTAELGAAAITDVVTAGIAIGAWALLAAGRVNPVWLIAAGATIGAVRGAVAG
jgi:chromate transporter